MEFLSHSEDKKLRQFFHSAKEYRDTFSDKRVGALLKTYDITVDVEDKPGVIAAVAGELGKHRINIKNIGINNSREMEGGAMAISFYDRESQEKATDFKANGVFCVLQIGDTLNTHACTGLTGAW